VKRVPKENWMKMGKRGKKKRKEGRRGREPKAGRPVFPLLLFF